MSIRSFHDKRCREVAERLRDVAYGYRDCDEVPNQEILAVLDLNTGDEGYMEVDDVYELAGMIDHPACVMIDYGIGNEMQNGMQCSHCGKNYISSHYGTLHIYLHGKAYAVQNIKDWNYCPNCGREITE